MRIRQIALLTAVLVALGAAAVVVGAHRRAPATPVTAAAATAAPHLAEIARAALPATSATPALDRQSPVVTTYTQYSSVYLGELTLWLSCAGFGDITLVVSGIPTTEANSTTWVELARITADCTEKPTPVRAIFVGDISLASLAYQLTDSASAAGRAAFAYRVTSDTGEPVSDSDGVMNPAVALHLTSDAGYGSFMSLPAETEHDEVLELTGRYTLAGACAGRGTVHLRVGEQAFKLKCSWPPVRQNFRPDRLSGRTPLSAVFRSTSQAPAETAWQFIPR